ncbi:hypothetical protein SRS16P2_00404 (plasmid) [Variovorax sp. SRS16]|uniref:hypothetical protein n=1 Tax=Variovorax sp. SRS16 TaxID=282217 RepID=UPI001319834F|nr:hypothetical protein [Variovorax sp. SRS16]VTU45947.1 hypothetical protein SRS16P2_00404 [Variovorax sp. SRS16]
MSTARRASVACAAQTLVGRHFCAQPGEAAVLTVDEASDPRLVEALSDSLAAAGAKPCVMRFPRLPLQGSLADPHIPEPVASAVLACDIWFDLSFPYLAGSGPFDRAMARKRARYLLLGDLDADGFARLYGGADFDALFDLQDCADSLLASAQGQACRLTTPAGTDLVFRMGKPANAKHRQASQPGAQTVPGSAIFYPELESVKGTIVLEAVFHDHYGPLESPLTLTVDGRVREVRGDAQRALMDRALRRAGGGEYGHVIHLTIGLHPAARTTGHSFIEDIRVVGRNAIGLGLPWWLPGGGENHPDGVVHDQSLWLAGEQVMERGRPVSAHPLARLLDAARASVHDAAHTP